jgi:hypothetical protein
MLLFSQLIGLVCIIRYVALMIMHLGFFFFAYFVSGIRNFIVRYEAILLYGLCAVVNRVLPSPLCLIRFARWGC